MQISLHHQEESARHRNDIIDVMPLAAYTCDAEGRITHFNKLAVDAWGREPKLNDASERYCGSYKLFCVDGSPLTHDSCWMALALHENQGYNEQEVIVERPDGTRRVVLAHANPFFDEKGRLLGAINILIDITERKQAEEAAKEADRRKTEFLAMLAHELRNPLAPLRNGLQIMRIASQNPTAVEQARNMMDRQFGHMVRIIDDLLDVSRIERGKIELRKTRIDLMSAVQDAVETSRPYIEEAGHKLTVTPPDGSVIVDADRTRLAQVFSNLLNNSARYTDRGGHICLKVERQGSDVVVSVTDNGAGIPATMLPQIFEMFSQTDRPLEKSRGGLGIGLSLVRGLTEMHGGSVEAHSEGEGKGSEFRVRLPVLLPQSRPTPETNGAAGGCTAKCRILVVDDNKDAAVSLTLILKLMGYETQTAFDGAEALKCVETFKPTVALLDIGLPKISGYEVARRIREQPWGREMVLIAQTGYGQEEDKLKSKQSGFNFHTIKPVDPAALERMLSDLLVTPR
jgi:PAS domain S-box-containing protein